MSDIATLGIRIDARQVRDADSALDHLANTGARTERAVEGVNSSFERMQRLAASVGVALGAAEIIKQADAWANLQGQLSLVADGQERLAQTTDTLFNMAQRTRQQLQATVDLYTKLARSTENLNKTDTERLRVTETINKTLAISHASTEASAAALLQLGQAFSANRLGGEELNSILEQTPALARAIAEGMGKTVGDLKAMGAAGKLTGEAVFTALERMGASVDTEFAKLPTTIGQAMTQVQNSVLRTIGVFDQQNQLSVSMAHALTALADNMDRVAGAALAIAAVKLAFWLQATALATMEKVVATNASINADRAATAAAIANAEAAVAQAAADHAAALGATERAAALARLTVAEGALTAAQGAGAAAAGWGARALGLLGGPVGIVSTLLMAGATAWAVWGNSAKDANEKARDSTVKTTQEIIDDLTKQNNKLLARMALAKAAGMKDAAKAGGPGADRLADMLQDIIALQAKVNAGTAGPEGSARLIELQYQYTDLANAIENVAANQAKLQASSNTDKVNEWLAKHTEYLDKSGKVAAAIAEARKELGDAFNSDIEKKIRASFDKADVDKAKNAYQELIAGIREKIAANQIEIAVGRDATEAQKAQIQFDQQLAAGKLKLNAAQRASVQATLDTLAATEKQAAMAQLQKDIAKAAQETTLAQQEGAATLAVYAASYGKISDARDIDLIAVKNQFDMLRKFNDVRVDDEATGWRIYDQMQADTDARTKNEQAILAQSKAFQYADQLRQENRQFSVDYTIDPKAKAAAQLAIDKAMWQSRIALAEEGTDARKNLEAEYTTWLQNQQIKPQLDAQIAMWSSIEQAARDAFVGILSNGKSTFERLRDSLKNTLYAFLYEMTVKKWIIQVEAQTVAATSAGGQGGTLGNLGTLSNAYNTIKGGTLNAGGSMLATAGNGLSALGSMAGLSSLGTAGSAVSAFGAGFAGNAAGTMMSASEAFAGAGMSLEAGAASLGASVAAAVPYVAAALAVYTLFKKGFGHGATEVAGQGLKGMLGADGNVSGQSYTKLHQDGGWFTSDRNWTESKDFTAGMQAQLTNAFATIETAAGGMAKTLGLGTDALNTYTKAFDITLSGDATKDQQAIADFFGTVSDEIANRLVPNLATFSQSGETASATLERLAGEFAATTAAAQNLGKTAAEAFGSAGMDGATARERLVQLAGGASNLTALTSSFAQQYLTDAERLAPVAKALDAALGNLGLTTVPATTAEFKALVQSLNPADEASAKLLVSLLQLSDAFYQVHNVADDTAAALADKMDAAFSALQRAVDAQKDVVTAAYNSALKGIDAAIDKTKSSVSKLTSLSNALHDAVSAAAGVNMGRGAAQAQIRAALAIAKAGGPLPSADGIKDALSTVAADSKDQFSTFQEYQRDRLQTAIDIANLATVTDDQLSTAQMQLDALQGLRQVTTDLYNAEISRLDNLLATAERQVDAIKGVDVSVKSVEQAIAALQALTGGSSVAGIVGAYGNALGRAPDASGLAYWQDRANSGTSMDQIVKEIGTSTEASDKIEALYKNILGRSSDAAGKSFWTQALANGTSLAQITKDFYNSDEYLAKVVGSPSSMNTTSGNTSSTSAAMTDATITAALNRIASYTQRAAVAAEDTNRANLETA